MTVHPSVLMAGTRSAHCRVCAAPAGDHNQSKCALTMAEYTARVGAAGFVQPMAAAAAVETRAACVADGDVAWAVADAMTQKAEQAATLAATAAASKAAIAAQPRGSAATWALDEDGEYRKVQA